MLAVLAVELVEEQRRVRHHLAGAGVLGVERAQRVQLDARPDLLGEPVLVRTQVRLQAVAVLPARLGTAEARQAQARLSDPQVGKQSGQKRDRLGVHRGIVGAQRLRPDLPELPVTARLGALVAEEAGQVPELHRLAALVHAVFDVGAAHWRGALGAQRQRAPAAVLESEHLLADDVRRGADAAGEQLGRLERGGLDPLVAGAAEDRASARLERLTGDRLLAEHVEGAARRFELRPAQRAAWGGGALAATGCSGRLRAARVSRSGTGSSRARARAS